MSINFKNEQIQLEKLNSLEKLTLIKSVMEMVEKNEKYMFDVRNYILDIRLIYTVSNSVKPEDIRLLFYPDPEKKAYNEKLANFIRECGTLTNAEDCIWMNDLIHLANENKLGELKETIDKKISLLEQRASERKELTKERLEVLFYNALILLFEEYGHATYDDLAERLGLNEVEELAMDIVNEGETSYLKAYEAALKIAKRKK